MTTPSISVLDPATAALVRLSARITAGSEASVRDGLAECSDAAVPDVWVEELMLQSYLFAGFPRALNAAREWRRAAESKEEPSGSKRAAGTAPSARSANSASAPSANSAAANSAALENYSDVFDWRVRGEATCAVVYGESYEKLRGNIRRLHPALDEWMIVEGYGKVLSRGGLDLARRELCIVAACVAAAQERQLHSHLHGARHAGVPDAVVGAALGVLRGLAPEEALASARLLWERVKGK